MRVILSPVASNKTTSVSITGFVITIDGIQYDLSAIPEGGQAEASEDSPFIGILTRDQATVRYEYESQAAEPNQSTDWGDYTFDTTEGEALYPIVWKTAKEHAE